MEILKIRDYDEMCDVAAQRIIKQVKSKSNSVLGLATGSTPLGVYQRLVSNYREGHLSYDRVQTFNLDEYVGLSPDHPNSYCYYMRENLFSHLDLQPANTHLPKGEGGEEVCGQYEEKITKAGGIDLQILGLGLNGHIGFNEPGTSFSSRTHVVELDDSTRIANQRFFNNLDEVPTHAVTMGIATIMDSREILLLVQGEKKADTLQRLLEGEITESLPGSVLRRHPRVTLIADEAALSKVGTSHLNL